MMYSHIISSPRGHLTLHQSLQLANFFLEHAAKTQDSDIALVLCHETEVSLSQTKKAARHTDDTTAQHGIGTAYIGLGKILEGRGLQKEAKAIYKKAEKLGVKLEDKGQLVQPTQHSQQPSESSSMQSSPLQPSPSQPSQPLQPTVPEGSESSTKGKSKTTESDPKKGKPKQSKRIATIPPNIFDQNVPPQSIVTKLPDTDERLTSTPQLACCLGLLKNSHTLDNILEENARNWLQVVENDEDEQERLKVLATDVVRTFKKEEIKDSRAVAEVVCLAPILDKEAFRDLLKQFYDGINHSELLDFHQLEGLAQMIQGVDADYVQADDLVKILELLSRRLQDTNQRSPQYIYQLTLTVSFVLDAMADTKVEGLDRETLHEPLLKFLGSFKVTSDPFLMYQVAYAYQALLCVPDNETLWQATLRRSNKVIKGISGLVSAVKGFDLNGFIDGLSNIQQGFAGASEVIKVVVSTFDDVKSLADGGKGFLKGLKEGLSFQRKCAWYPALRGADALIQDGEFVAFRRLVCEAPCRMDPAFQWGVCLRLAEIAVSYTWDARTRRSATSFLGEIYRNEDDWGDQASIKEWILSILMRLASSTGNTSQFAESLVRELEASVDAEKQTQFQSCREKDITSYPLKVALTQLTSSALLDRVQSKPDVEGNLRLLRKQRLKERGNAVYIQPQAKPSVHAADDARFPLIDSMKEFLDSKEQKVYLLLGDSGAGKSTFNKQLECDLWEDYKKGNGVIPLHINLPAIDKPEQDMVAKRLRKAEFTEPEIRELKTHRTFVLICDGYDESQQTHNLYMSNRLNQDGEWKAKMIISCRIEYLGVDYRDRFQPGDRNHPSEPGQFQEAVITPFSEDQVHDYIKQYVLLRQPLWETKDYIQTLDLIPSLKDLVKNPFLMTLSLEVLPRMVDPGEQLSANRVTRVALYDQFIEHWLERGKKRLGEKEMSPQAKAAFESLVDEGFTRNGIDFLKKLAVAIYKEQGGQPIVHYSRFKDEGSWKTAFFSREDERQLLREACPLTRSGNQHRFIHRSLLEYGMALAMFDPHDWKEKVAVPQVQSRRGSVSSNYSFQEEDPTEESASGDLPLDPNSPLVWRYFSNDPSILQFLTERVQQEPLFKKQLLGYIKISKVDVQWRKAAANAITVLVRAGMRFNGEDLRGVKIPNADLSYGVFDSAQLQGADLRQVNFRGAWIRQADLSDAQMGGTEFGELPLLQATSYVSTCAYSPDGKSIAVGLDDGTIQVYSTSRWESVQSMSGHKGRIWRVAYSPNGERLVSCGGDGTVRLWEAESGKCIQIMKGHRDKVYDVAYSPRGNKVVSVSGDKTVRLWDVEAGDCSLNLTGHTGQIVSVAYSPTGRIIATGSIDMTIRLWDAAVGDTTLIMKGHTGWILCIAYSPLGNRIVSTARDRTLRLWDADSGECCRVFTGHGKEHQNIVFSPSGDMLASAGADGTVRLWNVETGDLLQVLTGHTKDIRTVVFSPRGDYVASGSEDKTVRLWLVKTGLNHQVSSNHGLGVSSAKYSPLQDQIASSNMDGSIRLWDVETGTCIRKLPGHSERTRDIDYSPNGDLLASCSDDQTVRLWDLETGECRQTLTGHDVYVYLVVFSPDGNQLASGSRKGVIKLWDVESGELSHTLTDHSDLISAIVYSPRDGKQMVSGSHDMTARVWDPDTGACLHVLGHGDYVLRVLFSPRGDNITTCSSDKLIRLWDIDTGECFMTMAGHETSVHSLTYSPQGHQIASGGDQDGMIMLWDSDTGEMLHTLPGHKAVVTCITYAPEGHQLLSGSADTTVRLWDVTSGQCIAAILGLASRIDVVNWDPRSDVRRFITGSEDGSVRCWEVVETEQGGGGGGGHEDGAGAGSRSRIRLFWGSMGGVLAVSGASIQGAHGLSQLNRRLLKQRGAEGEPIDRARAATQNLISMASVLANFRKGPSPLVRESSALQEEPSGDV